MLNNTTQPLIRLFPCRGMVILGSLALVVGVLGFLSSFLGRWCLSVLLFVALLINLGELALVISLLADLDKAVNSLVDSELNQPDVPNDNKRLLCVSLYVYMENASIQVVQYKFVQMMSFVGVQ